MRTLKIIEGRFIENEIVVVKVKDNTIRRRVYYDTQVGDLYILYKNNRYFYYEFMKGEY